MDTLQTALMEQATTRARDLGADYVGVADLAPARDFIVAHRAALAAVPSLFVSVSCSAASKSPGEREAARLCIG